MDEIIRSTKFSGELFDLSIPTLNNKFGDEHISYVMKYGITMPLQKYIDELEMILEDADADDKNEKRTNRLDFLVQCNEYVEIQNFFFLFTNYLNGGGSGGERWFDNQYNDQNMIITVAGGNIITVFGELLQNIVDVFIYTVNDFNGDPLPYDAWDINDDDYEAPELNEKAERQANFLFENSFSKWNKNGWDIINEGFQNLTATNQKLLRHIEGNSAYQADTDFSKEQLFFIIAKSILENDQLKELTEYISTSSHSDFDFKLSPNIHPDMDPDLDPENASSPASKLLKNLERKDVSEEYAGFALLRAKSLMICNDDVTYYPPYRLKQLKKSCANELKREGKEYAWVYSLFPQIMQEEYLNDIEEESDCYTYLSYLLEKKNQIGETTSENVSEIVKFYLTGYEAPESKTGRRIQMLPPSDNSTEAIISYLNYTSYHLNIYIKKWLENKLSRYAAPGGNWLRDRFSNYYKTCEAFISLDRVLYDEECCILRLGSDIITYFLNNPLFNTERILDSLIQTINNKRENLGLPGDCIMPPSDVVLAPNEKAFSASLKLIKQIFESTQYSELGFPDGIRVTINAIATDSRTPDDEEDADEYQEEVEELINSDPGGEAPYSEYVTFPSKTGSVEYEEDEQDEEDEEYEEDEEDEEETYGGYKSRKMKSRKMKSMTRKSRKIKSRKMKSMTRKSRKMKSRKMKSRKNKRSKRRNKKSRKNKRSYRKKTMKI